MDTSSDNPRAADRSRRPRRRLLSTFLRTGDASTAVEFGIVALPFFALMFAILETGMVFFSQVMLESGLNAAARMIRTGEAQEQGFDQAAFRQAVCDNAFAFISCDGNLYVDVRSFNDFQGITVPDALDADGQLTGDFTFDQGTAGEVVIARVFYEYPIYTPTGWHIGLGNMASGNRLLSSAMVFRNEPFGAILQ